MNSYNHRASAAATTTALLLTLPSFAQSADALEIVGLSEHDPDLSGLGEFIADVEAFASPSYVQEFDEAFGDLILEVAASVISRSKPLDTDFAEVIDQEFWNLL